MNTSQFREIPQVFFPTDEEHTWTSMTPGRKEVDWLNEIVRGEGAFYLRAPTAADD